MSLTACLVALIVAGPTPAPVAHVVAGTNTVTVLSGGKSSPVVPHLALALTDELDVPVGGFVLVKVDRNGMVVRIDEDLQLKVGDIAALKVETPAGASLEQQIDALLTPVEKSQRGTERMVGWFISPTAANVLSSATVAPREPAPEKRKRNDTTTEKKAASFNEALGGTSQKSAEADSVVTLPAQRTGGPAAPAEAPASNAPPAPPPPPTTTPAPSAKSVSTAPVPAAARPPAQAPPLVLRLDAETRRCLVDAVRALGPAVVGPLGDTLAVKVRRGADTRVFLEGALPVPACLQAWAAAQPAMPNAWTTIEVPLK